MVEITDYESAEAWLKDKSRAVQVAFAARCALRALPGIGWADDATLGDIALPVMRAMLIPGVAGTCPTPEIRQASAAAAHSASAAHFSAAFSAASAAYAADSAASAAAHSAAASASAAAHSAAAAAHSAADSAAFSAHSAAFSAASEDATSLDPAGLQALFVTPLWPVAPMPEGLSEGFAKLRAFWDADPDTWGFWRDWYQGMLDGQPMDWALQEKIALIPKEDWEKGAAHVAGVIAEIRARFDLEKRIAELESELALASQDRLGIGGNHPPEPIEEAPAIAKELVIVWGPIQELKEELQAEDPDPSRIAQIVGLLLSALRKGLGWCAAKADLAVDTTIKWGIPAAGGGYLALNPDKLEQVIHAAQTWQTALQNILN
ncbi:hypothetical protein RGUI_3729 [Rhodovulum sp. P5]|uniref:hypothetical protein n=1 Tax=Rhodovulum sp. P5 TaxID=1564506 RepID=UPI0009C31377|nr:hypothetical protein [Rhodovulum sp. P5]ARE41870.1 hypothetical protein RGUI_3729 [Rhodovulum sp. P5]